MKGRLIAVLIALVPVAASATDGCKGAAFGSTTKRYLDLSPPAAFHSGLPEGQVVPAHLATASFYNWGCASSFAVDMDTGLAWMRLQCADPESFNKDLARERWKGAQVKNYTDARGGSEQEAVKEARLAPADMARLICLANDAWGAGKWGELPEFDAQGVIVEPDHTPYPPSPHGFSSLHLKDGGATRTQSVYYHSDDNPHRKLTEALMETVEAAAR